MPGTTLKNLSREALFGPLTSVISIGMQAT